MDGNLEGSPVEFNGKRETRSGRVAARTGASVPPQRPAPGRTYIARGAGDVPLFVRELGAGPPLVVLHGGPGAHHDYLLPYLGDLAETHRLYLYDQRGGGRSPVGRPQEIGWRDHVADLRALTDEWVLERPSLLGYSWGALLALLFATEHSDRCGPLVLMSPAAAWGDFHRRFKDEFARRSSSKEVRKLREELEASGLAERDPGAYRARRFDLSVAGYFRDPRHARGLTPFKVQAQAQQHTWQSLAGYGPELKRRLAALKIPALILHGRHDPLPFQWAEELADTLPNSRLVTLERAGHVPYVEEPDRTFEAIRAFLGESAG